MTKLFFFFLGSPHVPLGMRVTMTKFYLYFDKESYMVSHLKWAHDRCKPQLDSRVVLMGTTRWPWPLRNNLFLIIGCNQLFYPIQSPKWSYFSSMSIQSSKIYYINSIFKHNHFHHNNVVLICPPLAIWSQISVATPSKSHVCDWTQWWQIRA